jgi:hypothetical protein
VPFIATARELLHPTRRPADPAPSAREKGFGLRVQARTGRLAHRAITVECSARGRRGRAAGHDWPGRITPRAPLDFRRNFVLAAVGAGGVLLLTLAIGIALHRAMTRPGVVASTLPMTPRPLANDGAPETAPSLSPDGQQVVYTWRREDAPGLYIKPVAGGIPRRLALDGVCDARYCSYSKWSPIGDLIAFLANEEQDVRGMYVAAPSGARRST